MDEHSADDDGSEPAEPTTELYGFVWATDPTAILQPEPQLKPAPTPESEPEQAREPEPRRRRPSRRVLVAGVAVALIGAGVAVVGWQEGSHSSNTEQGMPLSSTVETVSLPAAPPASGASSTSTGPSSTASPSAKASASPTATATSTASHSAQATQIVPTTVGSSPTTAGGSIPSATVTSSAATSPSSDSAPGGYGTTDLALSRPVSATSYTETYAPTNITDGNVDSYWEGSENSFPQTVTIDLGAVQWVAELKLSLPQDSDWNSRTQTIAVYGSRSGRNSNETLAAATGYTFNAENGTGDAATITFAPQRTRYLILQFTSNTGWPAAQLSELSAYS
jgi:hypothetical protein